MVYNYSTTLVLERNTILNFKVIAILENDAIQMMLMHNLIRHF